MGWTEGVARMEVVLKGSGAVDNVSYTLPGPALDGIVSGTVTGGHIHTAKPDSGHTQGTDFSLLHCIADVAKDCQ